MPKHHWDQSLFHRSVDFCGSCHDVSNPVVGDLAPNNGAQLPLVPGTFDGQLDTPTNPRNIEDKAAFNNPPYKYGVVERTFSEYKANLLSQTLVSDYLTLPADLQDGSIQLARGASLVAGTGGNYADGAPRYFSCQTCHMPATTALGCNKAGVPLRTDQPMHDLTGGNYWMPQVMQYMDNQGALLLAGNLSSAETLREDGAYGPLQLSYDITGDAVNDTVDTLLDLHDPNAKVYEAHGAITQEWASKLIAVSASYGVVPVAYDRETGAVTHTVADVATLNPGEYHETFHFVLNNKVVKDNRIPPYGMAYDESLTRSILPVPATQYGDPGPGGAYDYWDDFVLSPPAGAVTADISLMYQPTSWEYIQFLDHANDGSVAFLADEGANMLDAWLNTGMATPHAMASMQWVVPDADGDGVPDFDDNCPNDPNPLQENNDGDASGDACDADDDTDGDGYLDGADPVPLHFNYADGDVGPWGARDTEVNISDLLICAQFVIGLREPTDEDLAHGDLYPVGAPDGEIGMSDFIQLQKLLVE